jgi:beta-lactamase class A
MTAVPGDAQAKSPHLRECFDNNLQLQLEKVLENLDLAEAVRQKKLSLALVDLTDQERPKVAAVNGDQMIYAASLPKIAILLGAFKQIENGEMGLDETTKQTLTDMIRYSSNEAASKMLRRVGPQRVSEILRSPPYRLYDPEFNGGLWCGKEYGRGQAWERDPLHDLSHGATALQTARLYYLLETRQLLSPSLTREMKNILSNPQLHHKFVKGLESRPGCNLYRKSGTWKQWHADSAIVEYGNHKYIVVGLVKHPNGGEWLERIIVPLHDLIVAASPPERF